MPQIGFKNALNTMGLNLQLSEMLELYNRQRNRLDINGIYGFVESFLGWEKYREKMGKYKIPQYYP